MHTIHSVSANYIPIPDWPGYYIDDKYQICSAYFKQPRALKPVLSSGYLIVCLRHNNLSKTMQVHQLILTTFKGKKPFPGAVTRHLDGNPLNNHPDNLVWGTYKENYDDMVRHGKRYITRGNDNKQAVLNEQLVKEIYALKGKYKLCELDGKYPVGYRTISKIWNGKLWKHVTNAPTIRNVKRLNPTQVFEIRNSTQPRQLLAIQYSLTPGHITKIRHHKRWKSVNIAEIAV